MMRFWTRLTLMLILTVMVISCQTGIKFDPQWHNADHLRQSIVYSHNGNENQVFTDEPEFDQYACMHINKIQELAEILKRAKIPKEEIEPLLP